MQSVNVYLFSPLENYECTQTSLCLRVIGSGMAAIPASEEDKASIRSALVVDRRVVFQKLLDRVKRVVLLDDSGHAYLNVPREQLTDSQNLALHLVARWFAHAIELAPTDTMTADDLARATGVPYKTVTARAATMKREGWLDADERGAYRIRYAAIEQIVSEVEARTGGVVPP